MLMLPGRHTVSAPEVGNLQNSSVVERDTRVDPAGGNMVDHDIADFLDSSEQDRFLIQLALRFAGTDLLQHISCVSCWWRADPGRYVLRLHCCHEISHQVNTSTAVRLLSSHSKTPTWAQLSQAWLAPKPTSLSV